MLAGGQSLVPLLSMRLAAPEHSGGHQPADRAQLRRSGWRHGRSRHGYRRHGYRRHGTRRRARPACRRAGEPGGRGRAAAAAQGAALGRAPGDPKPGHDRRQPRARRPVRRDACGPGAARRDRAGGQRRRRAHRSRPASSSSARWSRRCSPASWPSRHSSRCCRSRRRHRVRRDQQAARRLRGLRRRGAGVARPPTAASAARTAAYLSVAPSPSSWTSPRRSPAPRPTLPSFPAAASLARGRLGPQPTFTPPRTTAVSWPACSPSGRWPGSARRSARDDSTHERRRRTCTRSA